MKRLITHIIYLALGILLVALTVEKTTAQIVVDQCDTMEFSVVSRPNIPETHFVWAIYNSSDDPTDVLDPAGALDPTPLFVDGMYAGRTVRVTGLGAGKYYVRIQVWDEVTCTDNVEMYVMEVIENLPTAELIGDSLCIGEPAEIKIIFTGKAPYNVEYTYGDGTNIVNLNGIIEDEITIPITVPLPVGTTNFWVMTVTDDCTVNSYELDPEEVGVLIYPIPVNSKIYLKE
jgi:hypothetical protein